jgi:hypothetical protein
MDLLFNLGNHPMKFEHGKPNGTYCYAQEMTIFTVQVIVTCPLTL